MERPRARRREISRSEAGTIASALARRAPRARSSGDRAVAFEATCRRFESCRAHWLNPADRSASQPGHHRKLCENPSMRRRIEEFCFAESLGPVVWVAIVPLLLLDRIAGHSAGRDGFKACGGDGGEPWAARPSPLGKFCDHPTMAVSTHGLCTRSRCWWRWSGWCWCSGT